MIDNLIVQTITLEEYLDLSSILKEVDFENSEISRISSGMAGVSYKVETKKRNYFLKLYSNTYSDTDFISEVNSFSYNRSFMPLLYSYGYTSTKKIKYILLEFIENELKIENVNSKIESRPWITNFTETLLQLHQEKQQGFTSEFIDKQIVYLECKELFTTKEKSILSYLKRNTHEIVEHELVMIHGDYHPWNFLLQNNKGYMIDMKDRIGDIRYDVYWTYSLLNRTGFKAIAHEFLKEYRKYNQIVDQNSEYFIILASFMWYISVRDSNDHTPFLNQQMKKAIEMIQGLINKKRC